MPRDNYGNDNPPYITVVELYGAWHVNVMEWDTRADGYQITIGKLYDNKGDAVLAAAKLSRSEGIELR